ncbi:recombinase family protein [Pontibacter akesuensis]|uniref:Site-specific DNA recombinase n=1 Tax=Pontibacter akesuensis TaxID=388950 RepID=A0A1I7IMK0_9BACT|nr:recombinase family protein [Pontibacter akesuensis]GHA67881.1 resolvase [Pontibacter akesuensis]SFU74132.1 Site-specific DNA recombinase [Pontibacter akesuensis]
MSKVALLVRVSTNDQTHDRQIKELNDYAAANGYKVVDTITETVSGAKRNEERKGIQQLLKLAKTKKIDKVLVHEVTRLGRDTSQVLATLEDLHKLKVSVVVMNYQLDTLKPNGEVDGMAQFLITILADIGRMERATLVERVKSGMAEARRQGKHVGRPEGSTKDGRAMLNEYKQVVKCLKEGQTVRDTAKLCDVGVSTVQRVKKLLVEAGEVTRGRS